MLGKGDFFPDRTKDGAPEFRHTYNVGLYLQFRYEQLTWWFQKLNIFLFNDTILKSYEPPLFCEICQLVHCPIHSQLRDKFKPHFDSNTLVYWNPCLTKVLISQMRHGIWQSGDKPMFKSKVQPLVINEGKTASMSMLTLFELRYTLKERYNIGNVGQTASMSMLTLCQAKFGVYEHKPTRSG